LNLSFSPILTFLGYPVKNSDFYKMNDKTQKPKLRFGIFHKLLLVLVLASTLPIIVVWYANYRTTTTLITRNVHQRLESVADTLVTQVNDLMEMNYHMLRENAADPNIRSMDPIKQRPILQQIKKEYPWIHSVLVINKRGDSISRADDNPLQNYKDRHYVKQILEGKPTAYQVLLGKTTKLPGLTLAAAIQDENGRLKGILAASMAAALISDRVVNADIGKTGYAFLLDEHGKVIAHELMQDTTFKKDFRTHPAFKAHREDNSLSLIFHDERGKEVISYMKSTNDGWTLITQQDHDEAFSAIGSANKNALLLLLITLVLVFITAYFLSRRLTRPIRHLTSIANDASLANFNGLNRKIAAMDRTDEVGELARSVQRLAVSLKVAIGRLNKTSKTK
jgi:methyl-accepting chemotaxis protein